MISTVPHEVDVFRKLVVLSFQNVDAAYGKLSA